jgi:hypothetical protein
MHPEKGNCNVCRKIHKAPNPLGNQTPKAKHTGNYKQKHKNQNYRKQLLEGVTGWNMQLKYITGIQKTVHTSQLDSVNVETDYKNSIIYRNVPMCHRREVGK